MRKALRAWQRASMVKAWNQWSQHHSIRSEQMGEAHSAASSALSGRRKKRAWTAWTRAREQTGIVRRCLQTIRMRSAAGAFRTWKQHASRHADLRRIEAIASVNVRDAALRKRCWGAW